MSTQKPLNQMIPQLTKFIESNRERLNHARKLQSIYEGMLLPYLLEVLKSELSPRSYQRMVPRVVPINILTKIINKLSALYAMPVIRRSETEGDSDIMESAIKENKLNSQFALANKIYSLHQYFAVEPYFHKDKVKTRILDPSKFLVYSDDVVSGEMTVFLKYMGELDDMGKQLWFAYSDEEFIAFDTNNVVHTQYLQGNDGVNPYGEIPFTYVNQVSTKLMPTVDTDIFELTMRIPQLLSDLNYCHKFQAHSMIYGIDLDPESQIDGNPDGFTLFSTREGENVTGKIDFLKPQVEIEASISLIRAELSIWLESKGIKSGNSGNADSNTSGIAKILDEMDTTQARAEQVDQFSYMEDNYWKLYSKLHNYHVKDIRDFRIGMTSEPLASIKYTEQKPLEDEKIKLEKIALKLDKGLTSKRRALEEANPELNEEQIEELMLEIEKERAIISIS